MYKRYFNRFPHALRGLKHAATQDFGFRTQLYGVGLVLVIIGYLLSPISDIELLFILLSYALILITELQNSALEVALDKLHPDLHEAIGVSKDMAAASVLIAGLFLIGVLVSLLYSRLDLILSLV